MPSGYSEITAWKSMPYNWSSSPSFLAVSAWWGYTTAADKQRLEALLLRAVRVGL